MEWHEKYDIGIEIVDGQHQEIFRMVTKLQDSLSSANLNKEIVNALIFMVKYTQQHFTDEEKLMTGINYPELSRQRDLHKKMIKEVNKVVEGIKLGKPIDIYVFVDFLVDWLLNHILKEDRKIGDFISRMKIIQTKETRS